MPRAYGTVIKAGEASKQFGKMDRRGPSTKNLGPSRKSRPNPAGAVRSTGQQVKGPDKGAG